MTIDEFLARLGDAKRVGGGWQYRCPAHDDGRASLSVGKGRNGGIVLKCHAGCETTAVVAALGLTMRDLAPDRSDLSGNGSPRGRIVATYDYRNESGALLFQTVRFDPKDFRQRKPDSNGGWVWSLGEVRRVLYRLPELLSAPADALVFVVEGEKDADTIANAGGVATCNPMGAGKWRKVDDKVLEGRRVSIVADADTPGRKHAQDVARTLHGRVKSLRVIEVPRGKDATEFFEAGGTLADLHALADAAPEWTPATAPDCGDDANAESRAVIVRMSEVEPTELRWLWPGRIPLGKLTLVAGDPGLGKSFVTLDLVARVTRGARWPDNSQAGAPIGGAVILSAEDDPADTIRPRLDAAGADVSRVALLQAVRTPDPDTGGTRSLPFTLASDMDALEEAVRSVADCRLIIIDPISAYLGGGPRFDSHRNSDVRAILAPLADLAGRLGVAVVAVTHLRKGEGPAMYRAMGSLAFVAAARAVIAVARDTDDPTGRRRLFLPVKHNLSADPTGLAYELRSVAADQAVIAWSADPVSVTADDVLGANRTPRGRAPERTDEAVEFLRGVLADGARQVNEIRKEARDAGISWRTVQRAKEELRIYARKAGFDDGWQWHTPKSASIQNSGALREFPEKNTEERQVEVCGALRGSADAGPDRGEYPNDGDPRSLAERHAETDVGEL
ncbi:MAG: AAA family ATPase [Phycisphaerae bacterium]